jgi:hypothetical protein
MTNKQQYEDGEQYEDEQEEFRDYLSDDGSADYFGWMEGGFGRVNEG